MNVFMQDSNIYICMYVSVCMGKLRKCRKTNKSRPKHTTPQLINHDVGWFIIADQGSPIRSDYCAGRLAN